jgi:hypothetical protein
MKYISLAPEIVFLTAINSWLMFVLQWKDIWKKKNCPNIFCKSSASNAMEFNQIGMEDKTLKLIDMTFPLDIHFYFM